MGTFALPIPAYRLGQHSNRKRKRSSASLDHDEETPEQFTSEPPSSPPVQPSLYPQDAVINPRSHDPDTLRQFAVAGLAVEAEVPSKLHPSFPHKALPGEGGLRRRRRTSSAQATSGSEADVDTDASEGRPRAQAGPHLRADELSLQYSARMRHINTLTAVLHRFLHEGDMPRARRAFSLLLRTRDIDLRLNGLWNVGAEILMQGDETPEGRQGPGSRGAEEQSDKAEAKYGEGWVLGDEPAPEAKRHDPGVLRRWGTAANTEKVTEYLRDLAQQYPYDQFRPQLTSAIDFWPALFSIEIYNADAEFRLARHRLAAREDADETEGSPSPPPDLWQESLKDEAEEEEEEDDDEDDYEARIRRRSDAREARHWAAHDVVRRETQDAAQQIAARMDGVMENRPFTDHLELLRLRALLALYIGDLHLPARFVAEGRPPPRHTTTTVSRDDRVAFACREQEFDKARALFRRILDRGGSLEPRMQALLDGEDTVDDAPDVEMW